MLARDEASVGKTPPLVEAIEDRMLPIEPVAVGKKSLPVPVDCGTAVPKSLVATDKSLLKTLVIEAAALASVAVAPRSLVIADRALVTEAAALASVAVAPRSLVIADRALVTEAAALASVAVGPRSLVIAERALVNGAATPVAA